MRLLIVGAPGGRLTPAAGLAEESGADISYAEGVTAALKLLSAGDRADLLVVDATLGIRDLVNGLSSHSRQLPVIACGNADRRSAKSAIEAGAREYLPLPPTPDAVAALLVALARDDRDRLRAATIWNMS